MPYLTRFGADAFQQPANASSAESKPPETASIPAGDPSWRILRSPEIIQSQEVGPVSASSPGFV